MTVDSDAAVSARELESQLGQYPEERGEILVEAAHAWHRAGEHDRAVELLDEAVGLGAMDGAVARVTLADVLYDLGRDDEADAQLATVRAERPKSSMPYELAAELLEERGDARGALKFFNMAVSRLDDAEMARLRTPDRFSFSNTLVSGRRRVRRALGMPADELDGLVTEPGLPAFASQEDLSNTGGDRRSTHVRVLFWPRTEIPRAHESFPEIVQHDDAATVVREREVANRDLADSGVARIIMVPLTVARLQEYATRTGRDPRDETTRKGCMDEIADTEMVAWPPPRNGVCWCGSNTKYKKCCGRPSPG